MSTYAWVVGIVFVFYLCQFIAGQVMKNNSIVDIFWGLGFVLASLSAFCLKSAYSITSMVTLGLVSIWGLRLFYHIGKRNQGKPEDFRYQNFRKAWGNKCVKTKAFFHVYMLQLLMLLLISSAAIRVILVDKGGWTVFTSLGLVLWCLGFYFEVKADAQLRQFKSNPENKGKILTSGLYKYSRHPNYFGEAIMWWGIYVIGLGSGGWLFIISPITITILVRYVSGVPMLEKHYEHNEAFQAYAKETSIFIPWFPKR